MNLTIRTLAAICGTGLLFFGSTGCAGMNGRLSAEQAFALSASALSGSDNYGFAGDFAMYNPIGRMEASASFKGEVNGHGNLKLNWTTPEKANEKPDAAEESSLKYRPLGLLKAMGSRTATFSYADESTMPDGQVRIQIRLNEDAAKKRIADALRAELADVEADKRLYANEPERARKELAAASRKLEDALATLRVETVVLWTANSKNWFPGRMAEDTLLSYVWEGKPYSEKRTSVTNFLVKA